jgi:hypothetical protein
MTTTALGDDFQPRNGAILPLEYVEYVYFAMVHDVYGQYGQTLETSRNKRMIYVFFLMWILLPKDVWWSHCRLSMPPPTPIGRFAKSCPTIIYQ